MKLQIAIDRVTLSKAEEMAKIFAGKTDIIEMGTSLIKDYGLFALKKLNEYKKVMSEDDRKEFRRAIGLYASGIGAGAYVYLRRIFESLLEQAKGKAGDAIDIKAFNNAHVGEKITMLSSYLPSALTSNTVLYGILSKGIHELTEEQCLTYFSVLKDCLYMILDQWEEMRKKEEKEKSIKAALSKIATNIN